MDNKIVTLYIDDTVIRLLVIYGKRIRKLAELLLEPGLIEDGVVIKEAEVANKIKQFLKDQRVRSKKVIVGLSALLCLTRPIILPQLPKALLDEAVMREAKRLLPLALEQLYISWQTIPAPEGQTQVFLSAIRRKRADTLLKTLRQAGLNPYIMDIKPLALARLVKEATAVIVDVQPTEFDIVVMADGVPQPIRTVSFPSEALSQQEKLVKIKEDFERTIEFYNSNNPEKPLDSNVPIYVSGELADEPKLRLSLEGELGHPVLLLSSPLNCSRRLDPTRYMVNIGLALKEPSLREKAGPLVANLNLLPIDYQPKPISWTRVAAIPGAVALIGLLVPMAMFVQSASADIALMHNQLDTTNQLLVQRQLLRQEIRNNIAELEKKIAETEASRDKFTLALSSLNKERSVINGDLDVTTKSVPGTINLTAIDYTDNGLTITGSSPSEAEVLSYATSLDASERFSEIIIASMMKTEDGGINFILILRR